MLETPRNLGVACCITDLDFGGAEQQFTELVLGLARLGLAPHVVVLGPPPRPPMDQLASRVTEAAIPLAFLNLKHYWQLPSAARQLQALLRQHRPQIMQCFLHHANMLGAMAAHRGGVRHLVSGQRVADRRRNIRGWMARRLDDRFARHVCVSRQVARFVADEVGLPARKLVVIENGINIDRFSSAPTVNPLPHLDATRRWLLFAGRLDEQKRISWLLDRMPDLFARLPSHDLVIAGEGPLAGSLRGRAARLGIADRLHFLGWWADMPGLLAQSDIVLLASGWEGMPNIVLEAMATAKPLVATRVEGVVDALGDAANEQTVATGDATGFVEAVVNIASSPQKALDLGRRNRQRAASHFSIERMIDRYRDLYYELAADEETAGGPLHRP